MARINEEAEELARQGRSPLCIESGDRRFIEGFRIVVEREVGVVMLDGGSPVSPREAAFSIIGRSGEEGTFRFPHEDSGEVVVEVSHHD